MRASRMEPREPDIVIARARQRAAPEIDRSQEITEREEVAIRGDGEVAVVNMLVERASEELAPDRRAGWFDLEDERVEAALVLLEAQAEVDVARREAAREHVAVLADDDRHAALVRRSADAKRTD